MMRSLVTHSVFYVTVLYIALAAWILPEWIGSFLQRAEKNAQRRDRGSHVLIFVCLLAGILAAFYCVDAVRAATISGHQPVLFWTGIALMLGGIAFRWYAIRVLGRYFSRNVATRTGQTVIDHGPYRLIRHPSYSGSFITVFGFGLALTNWLSLLIVLGCALIGFSYRVRVEEQALCEALGQPYRDYMKHTRRFIPYVW